jgi:hypothetical protein
MIIGTSHKYLRQISRFLVLSAESGQRYFHNSKIRYVFHIKLHFLLKNIIYVQSNRKLGNLKTILNYLSTKVLSNIMFWTKLIMFRVKLYVL